MSNATNQNRASPSKPRRRLPSVGIAGSRRSLHDEIADILRDRVVEGDMVPGDFIDERAFASELGISRTPVREALKVLASEGLVEIFPNRGTFVSTLTPEIAAELIEVLAEVESFAAELAAIRATDHQIAAMRRAHNAMIDAFNRGDKSAYFKLNHQIHQMFAEASQNRQLLETFRLLTGKVRRIRFLSNLNAQLWKRSVQEHEAIQHALEARDARRLRQLMRDHVAGISPSVADILRQEVALGDRLPPR